MSRYMDGATAGRATGRGRVLGLLFLLLGAVPLAGQGGAGQLVIISGLSGEERFARDYLEWGSGLAEAAVQRYGLRADNVVWLAEDAGAHAGIRARSTRVNVEREVRALAQRAGTDDRILIILFGHGSFQAGESRINLPGPDVNGEEFAALLALFGTQRVAVVNATSASGGFVQDLAGPNRIVITATKSGMEANETVFGRHITAALTGEAADTDKDGRVSLLEAFEYARLEVEREYQRANKLQTEHAVLDAVGDGRGVAEAGDGPHAQAAGSFHLGSVAVAAAGASPELRALYEAKARIEGALAALRARRASMAEAEYDTELERLLVELSRNAQSIRRVEGGGS
ncbi:MAG: hypothetical protein KFH98_11640 [Gemmatimonadetes bacterium]|nr:hypothetical protein [Gemmatimonadota bacterium]